MTSFQQSIDRWSNLLDKPISAAEPPPADGINITDDFGSLISEARSALTDATAAPGSASADQDLINSAAASNQFETIMPDTKWAGLNLREVARGSQQNMSQAAAVIATPSLRAQFIQSLMKPAVKIAEWWNPPKTEYEVAIQNLTKRNLAQQLSMVVEPAGSGLTASPQDLQSEIIALRGTQQGLAQGQQEGFMGEVSRATGQSLPSTAVMAGSLVTGGSLLPLQFASMTYIPMASYTNGQLSYISDLEQQRHDQALAGETLSEFDPIEMGKRAEVSAVVETATEMGGATVGAKFISKIAERVGTSAAAKFAVNKFAKTGGAKAAAEVVRRSGSAAGRMFTAANNGLMNITPGFIYRAGQIGIVSGLEEAGEEGVSAIFNAPFTYAPLSQDINDALYSMAVASVSGGAGGVASGGGLAVREAVTNLNDAFRPENDRERIVRQTHSDAMKARSNWSEGLEQTQRDRIAAKLDTIEGMTPDERGTYVMALADRKAEIIANAEATLAERQEVDVAMTGAQEVLDKAKAAAGTASPTADQDIYEAEFALLVLQDKAKQLDEQLVLANTDHMIATAEHGAVAEKISDMPATVVRSTPAEVLTSVGTRSGVALNETKAPRWGKKIANEMEALGTQVVWYTPADKKSSNPGFHSRRTPGVIYLNAASNQQRVRAVALEEAFHDIQMFRPDIAKAFVDKAGLLPVYDAALEYVSRGGAETVAIARQDEAAFAQAENVAATLEGGTSGISPNAARAGAARISQEGEANAFARAMAGIKAKGAMSSLTRLAARSGLMGRESLAAMAVVDRVARSAAIEAVSGKTGDATLSPLARTLMWASDMDVDFARDIPTADRELSEPIPAPVRPAAPAQIGQVQTGQTAETTSTVGRRLVADAINTLGLTEEEVNATVIDLMTGLPKTKAFFANKVGKVPDVVKYFHERRLASGLRILDITKEEDQKTLAKLMAAEAIGAINSAGDALQWYDKTIRNTLAQAAIKYPELETDPRARMAFILSMAITSQTMNVEDNLAFSMVQYGKYRDTVDPVTGIGQFELAGKGKNAGAQANNFRIANVMLRTIGPDQMIRFLRTQFTAGQLSNAGLNIGGELKSEMVLGSAIFGPKIGFGFYSNLDGNFDPVTMDMWFMRTIGRLTGKLPAFDQNKYDKQIAKLKASLAEKGTNGIFPSTIDQALIDDANNAIDDSGLVKLARAVIKLHEKDFKDNRKDYDNKDRVQSKMVLASKSIIQSLDKPRDSPKSGGERRLLRKVVKLAVAHVSEIYGEDVANAAFQAMIWYPEQELYKSHGVKLKVTSQDYSGAIRKILKNEGITDGQLDTAIAAAERGSGLAQQVAGITDTTTGGLASNVPVGTRTFTTEQRASFLATTPVAIAKAWTPPAQAPNLDELQARFAGDFEAIRFTREQRRSAYSRNWQYGRDIVGNGTKPRILKLTDESGKKSSLPYIAEIAPGDALGIVFKKAGLLSPKFVELAPVKVSAIWFNKTVSAFKAEDKFGACVAAYPADDYVGMRLFIATNGRSGFAVKPDGDVISVFAYDKHGRAILEASTAVGGKKLDAFDTVLPVIYAAHGFRATSRLKFSEQEKPEDWNYETFKRFNNGRPDVVFMVNDPTSMTQYKPTDGQLVEDYGEAVAIQEKAVADVSFARIQKVSTAELVTDEQSKTYQFVEGKPVILSAFHGTRAGGFTRFDPGKIDTGAAERSKFGFAPMSTDPLKGFWFTNDSEQASSRYAMLRATKPTKAETQDDQFAALATALNNRLRDIANKLTEEEQKVSFDYHGSELDEVEMTADGLDVFDNGGAYYAAQEMSREYRQLFPRLASEFQLKKLWSEVTGTETQRTNEVLGAQIRMENPTVEVVTDPKKFYESKKVAMDRMVANGSDGIVFVMPDGEKLYFTTDPSKIDVFGSAKSTNEVGGLVALSRQQTVPGSSPEQAVLVDKYGIAAPAYRRAWHKATTGKPITVTAWHSPSGSQASQLTDYARERMNRDSTLGAGWYGARDKDVAEIYGKPEQFTVTLDNPYVFSQAMRTFALNIPNEELQRIRDAGHDGIIVKGVDAGLRNQDRTHLQVVAFDRTVVNAAPPAQAVIPPQPMYPLLAEVWRNYFDGEDYGNTSDLADTIEGLVDSDDAPQSLAYAIDQFREEVAYDRSLKGRGDMDNTNKQFESAVQTAAEQMKQPQMRGQSGLDVSFAREDQDQDTTALQEEIANLKRLVRDVQNTTAAQRVNALSEVRKLERKLNTMTMLAEQRLGQVIRAKARGERQAALMHEQVESANETIASLEAEITAKRDAVAAAKASIKNAKVATKEQTDALKNALLDAERTAERAINWAYQIGRNEGVTAGQVAGQQQAQPLVDQGAQAAADLKDLQIKARKDAQSSKRAIDWAYGIGRNEGLVAGQVAGQQQTRREMRPRMERLARVESLLDISVKRVRELKTIVKTNARSAQRAVNFAYSMGLNKGRMQGIMKGRAEILRKMRKREDNLQNQLFNLRELMNTRIDDIENRNRIIRKIVSDALLALPAKLRGTLANRAATATTVAQANRVAIEAIRIAINAEVTEGISAIKKTQKRMNKRGMKWAARQQIEKLLDDANVVLRDANNRKRTAKVVTAKGSPVTLVDAVALYANVIDAAAKVENAAALYAVDRAAYIAERDQRIVRYADLNQRILANMTGRRMIAARVRADEAARLSVISRISRANSDIYTLSLELEGKEDGVIDELLRLAQEGKGEAALEHARLMRDLEPALIAAGYAGVDDYRLRNGGYGDGSTELVTVSLGGKDVTIPLGIAMSIAAMDEETLELFDGTNAGKQGIQFRDSATTLTLYPSGADIRTIRANLTIGQRDLIEAMKDILETKIRDRAMEAIWQVEGDQPPIVERYYPRVRNMAGTGGEAVSVAAATGAAVRGALTAVGFANARTGGFTPLVYTDMVQTMDRHMQVALDMIHMAQPYRDAMTVLNNPEVVAAIDGQMGAGTANGVRSIFSNGVGATARTKPTVIDALTSNVTGAKLAMNPTTIAKVLIGGTIRLSSEIPLSLWTRGTARAASYTRKPGRWSDRIDEIHTVNGYFARRHQMQMKSIFSGALGDSDRAQLGNALIAMRDNLRAVGANLAARKITDAINSAGDVNRASTMALSAIVDALRYADEQIMLAAVEARLAEVEDEGLLTGRDALTEASNRAERDFRKTQNASDEFDDSYFAATSRTDGNAGWRLLFPFSSDPLKARNQIRRAVLTGNRTRTGFAVGGNIVSGTTISALSTIVTAKVISMFASLIGAGDDEDEKDATTKAWWENTLVSLPTQLAGEVMSVTMGYVGMVFANALSSLMYRRSAMAPLVASPLQDVGNEITAGLSKDATAIDKTQAIVGSSLATLQYGGIPFYPMYRLAMRSIELGQSGSKVQKTPREKLLDSIERKRKSLEKLRSN